MNPSAPPNIYPTIPPHPNYQAPPYPQQNPVAPQNQYQAPPYPANPPQQQLPYQQPPQQQQQNFPYQQQPHPQQNAPYPQQPPHQPNFPYPQQPGYFPNTQPPAVPPRQNSLPQTSGQTKGKLTPEMQKLEVSENKEPEKSKKTNKAKKTKKETKPEVKYKPLKSGQVEYGKSYTAMAGDCGSWFNYFVELCHDGKLKLSTYCKDTEEIIPESFLKIDKDWYVCVQNKKYVCLQYKEILHVLKPKSELLCEKWLHALSDYATAGPAMSGYVEKFLHSKGKYKKYFLRLKTNSSLDWFADHFEAESTILAEGCIQVRGTKSHIDSDAPKVVTIAAGKKNYKFKFKSASEADEWLKAFQFYSDKKQLKSVKFKNSA